jgi:hypothetical protein
VLLRRSLATVSLAVLLLGLSLPGLQVLAVNSTATNNRVSSASGAAASSPTQAQLVSPLETATQPGITPWLELGPKPITNPSGVFTWGNSPFSGRVTAIAINGSNPSIIYLGAAQGGVWKSTDGGTTWNPLSDSQLSLAVGSITLTPDGKTVYVGTGEPNHSGDSYYGVGLLKSSDGGKSWTTLGASYFASSAISSVVVSPGNPNRLLVSTTYAYCCGEWGFPIENTNGIGIFLSTDGGLSWTETISSLFGFSNIVSDATSTNVLYAGDYKGAVWRSTDSGSTWSQLVSYSNPNLQGRVVVATTPAKPGVLYQAFGNSTGGLIGIFRYNLSTAVETSLGIPPKPTVDPANKKGPCNSQCWYDLVLSPDPSKANVLYFGGVDLYVSVDSGNTWSDIGGYSGTIHPDQHALTFLSTSSSTIFSGNDGGIWKSTDRGTTWTDLSSGLGTVQFDSLAGSSPTFLFGGTQDNGCIQHGTGTVWTALVTGDGGWSGYETSNPSIMYCSQPYPKFAKSTDGGLTWAYATTGLNSSDVSTFYAPAAQDPNHAGTIYLGSIRVYKTTDYAQSWVDVSGVLSGNRITTLAVAPSNSSVVYLGDEVGNVKVSNNAGKTWQVAFSLVSSSVTCIAIDPTNANVAYVAFANTLTVYKLSFQSGLWLSTQLAALTASTDVIKIDPTTKAIYVGTDSGVAYSTDAGTTWASPGTGLPNVAVFALLITSSGQVIAGTHGRGAWAVTPIALVTTPSLTLSFSVKGGGTGYSPPVLTYVINGLQKKATLGTASTTITVDLGSAWSITNPLSGSGSTERWQTNQTISGTAALPQTVALVYYHQFYVTFDYNVTGGGSGYSAPAVSFTQFGSAAPASTKTAVWADAQSSYSYSVVLGGSTAYERWASSFAGGVITGSGLAAHPTYFHQFSVIASYSLKGTGTPPPPSLNATGQFGRFFKTTVTTSPTPYWIDSLQSWALTNPLNGSTTTERWMVNNVTAGGMLSQSITLALVYYHQYSVSFNYSVIGGGSGYSPPSIRIVQFGSINSDILKSSANPFFVDESSSWSITNPLSGSSSSERWFTTSSTNGTVTSPGIETCSYYHQYDLTISFSLTGGGNPNSPTLSATQNGNSYGANLTGNPTEYWLDSRAKWTVTNPLTGGTPQERWKTTQPVNGTVSQSATTQFNYQHQYYAKTVIEPAGGGSASNITGWHDSGTTIQISAQGNSGWKFEGWGGFGSGSYTGPANSTSVSFNAPVVEKATFYPGLTIVVGSGGSVSYTSPTASSTVPSSNTVVLYLPHGTTVSLAASSSSFLNTFSGWGGAASGSGSQVTLVLDSPQTVQANFSTSYITLGLIGAIIVGIAVAAVVILRRRHSTA